MTLTSYSKEHLQSEEFINELNNYVNSYNRENSTNTGFVELKSWKLDEKSGYPILDI